jgi:glutamyl-tRNA synthetase
MSSGSSHEVRVRVAPSPTGDPHVGTAYIALFDYCFARANGGKFVLRIEDTDRARSTLASEQAIMRSLKWIGLQWDEGPDCGGPHGPYRQSERSAIYQAAAKQLIESGHAYRCFCTAQRLEELRKAQLAAKGQLGYDGHCRSIPADESRRRAQAGEACVVRLAVPDDGETAFDDIVRGHISIANSTIDDQVLLKSDGFPTYHLANVVDDHDMRISHVIRAEEWISSTPKHVLLYSAFGWDAPQFAHMPLLRNPDKSKISKRKNPTSLDWYREQGFLPEALLNFLGLMGWSASDGREIFSLREMVADFSWDRVGKGAPVFDMTKLEWINGEYIRKLSADELARRLRESVPMAAAADEVALARAIPLARERLKKLTDFDTVCGFLFREEVTPAVADMLPKKRTAEEAAAALEQARKAMASAPDWQHAALEASCRTLAEKIGWKVGDLFMPIRVAVTGSKATPPLFESIEALGRERTLGRLAKAAGMVRGT